LRHLRGLRHRALIAALVEAREEAGLTQRQLAAKLRRSDSFVWKIEAGERRVDVLEFIEIAQCLGVEATELMKQVLK
jgi:transcriptional regulator with XRE-family HTH domain